MLRKAEDIFLDIPEQKNAIKNQKSNLLSENFFLNIKYTTIHISKFIPLEIKIVKS